MRRYKTVCLRVPCPHAWISGRVSQGALPSHMDISDGVVWQVWQALSHLGDQRQRSRNARKNQPDAGERWPSLDHRYAIAVCVSRSLLIAEERWWTLRVLNRFKTFNAHQRVRGDARWTLGGRYSIAPRVRGAYFDRCTRYECVTRSLYTLGERNSVAVLYSFAYKS